MKRETKHNNALSYLNNANKLLHDLYSAENRSRQDNKYFNLLYDCFFYFQEKPILDAKDE